MTTDNPFEQKFHDKFELIAKEFNIPFSRLSDLLGLSKNSIYALRKSNNWKPQTQWYLDKLKRLDYVRELLNEYRQFAIYHSKGKVDSYDATLFHSWTFSLWWAKAPRKDFIVVSPIPAPVTEDIIIGPPKPLTREQQLWKEAKQYADRIGEAAKP